jgi:hypothetical protein
LTTTGKSAWLKFRTVCINLLGNLKVENYKELVEDLLNAHQSVGYVSEDSFFTFPLALLLFEPGHVSDEHGESFHQDMSIMGKR